MSCTDKFFQWFYVWHIDLLKGTYTRYKTLDLFFFLFILYRCCLILLHYFLWENCLFLFLCKWCVVFLWLLLRFFFLSLVFVNYIIMYPGVVFFMIFLHRVCGAFWICEYIFSFNLGKTSAIISSKIFLFLLLLLLFWGLKIHI